MPTPLRRCAQIIYLHFFPVAIRQFGHTAEGSVTLFSILLLCLMLIIGGMGIDYAQAVMTRSHLQAAADSAAHAALVAREKMSESKAREFGAELAQRTLPISLHGEAITAKDIKFGSWVAATGTFLPNPLLHDAVQVDVVRDASRTNALPTTFLGVFGLKSWDMSRKTIFSLSTPICLNEGFVSEGHISFNSGNVFKKNFCLHSNSYVDVGNSNTFESNTIVSMPDLTKIRQGTGNVGLQVALGQSRKDIRILKRLNDVIAGVEIPDSRYYPKSLTSNFAIDLKSNLTLSSLLWVQGRIHKGSCLLGKGKLTIPSNTTLRKGVVITDCQIDIGSNVLLEDVILISTSTEVAAITGASNVQIGRPDNCAEGGGSQLLTLGGMQFPSSLTISGSQLIAARDITFSAQGNGVMGASVIAGGSITTTSNTTMATCSGAGMEANFKGPYYTMVR